MGSAIAGRGATSLRFELVRHVASARFDVLVFSGATAIVALHATTDSFLAPDTALALMLGFQLVLS